jgi:hypothetical protein
MLIQTTRLSGRDLATLECNASALGIESRVAIVGVEVCSTIACSAIEGERVLPRNGCFRHQQCNQVRHIAAETVLGSQ